MPMPNASSVIAIAARKLRVVTTLPSAAKTAESGGISMISSSRPTISHKAAQTPSASHAGNR